MVLLSTQATALLRRRRSNLRNAFSSTASTRCLELPQKRPMHKAQGWRRGAFRDELVRDTTMQVRRSRRESAASYSVLSDKWRRCTTQSQSRVPYLVGCSESIEANR